MDFITDFRPRDDEDLIQTAWMKALERTDERPPASTREEVHERYQHIAGLVVYIYGHEKVNARRQKKTEPLTNDLCVEDFVSYDLADCSDIEREAISYYMELIQQKEPLTAVQRSKISRLRKKSGLKLDLNY